MDYYQGLSDDEALEVGFLHNKKAELSKKMFFMVQARLIEVSVLNCISKLPLVLSPVYDPIKIHLYKVSLYIWWGLRDCFCPTIQFHINIQKKVQVGKDQENAQSEKDSHSKNQGGKKPN